MKGPPLARLISCCVPKRSFKIVPSNNNIDKYKKDNNSNIDNCNNNENNDNSDNDADMSSSSGHSLSTDESGCVGSESNSWTSLAIWS